jgi:hypothetical protein
MSQITNDVKNKIDNVKYVITLLPPDKKEFFKNELSKIEIKILMTISSLLPIDTQTKEEYLRKISTSGYIGKLENIILSCEPLITNKTKFKDYYEQFKKTVVIDTVAKTNIEICYLCGGTVTIDCLKSELQCTNSDCMAIYELTGTIFDDTQMFSQESQKSKSGTFNPNRHFQRWWDHILAREPEEEIGEKSDPKNLIGEKLLDKCRKIVIRDKLVLRMLTVNQVRQMLQELKMTKYNCNVPLIMKKLTGIGPPRLSDELAVRVENLFTKAIEIEEAIRPMSRTNRNYYSYYIFKILDFLIPEDDLENRRVLYYIYMQSKDTVESDDIEWKKICAELKEIEYKPTDRNMAQKYKPF